MKACIKSSLMIASFIVVLASQLPAQTFKILDDFNGSDGAGPDGLLLTGNTLYGVAGANLFAINTEGMGFRIVHTFTSPPSAGSTLSGNILNGITSGSLTGAVYTVNTDSAGFTFA